MSRIGSVRQWSAVRCVAIAVIGAVLLGSAAPLIAGEEKKRRCPGKLEECLKYLADKMKSSGWVGVELEIDEKLGTYTVVKVLEESPAEAAGIRPGDLLVAVNGRPIAEFQEEMLSGKKPDCWKPGRSVTYTIKRGGVDHTSRLILAPMPAEVLARYIGEHTRLHAEEIDKEE